MIKKKPLGVIIFAIICIYICASNLFFPYAIRQFVENNDDILSSEKFRNIDFSNRNFYNNESFFLIVMSLYCAIQLLRLKKSGRYSCLFLFYYLLSSALFVMTVYLVQFLACVFLIIKEFPVRAMLYSYGIIECSLVSIIPIIAFIYFRHPKVKKMFS